MKNHNDTKKPMRRKYNLFFRYMGFSIASVTISFLVLYIIFLLFVSGNWNNDRMEILQSNAMVIAEKTASLMADDVTEEDSYDSALHLRRGGQTGPLPSYGRHTDPHPARGRVRDP